MSLHTEMRAFVDENEDRDNVALAEMFLTRRTKRDLVPLLAEEFAHVRRGIVRAEEALALAQMRPSSSVPTLARVRDELGGLVPLLDHSYRIGDGVERRAGDMTVDDWRLRRTMLESQAAGVARAIEVCDRAIDAIEQAGVRTLRDIGAPLAVAA